MLYVSVLAHIFCKLEHGKEAKGGLVSFLGSSLDRIEPQIIARTGNTGKADFAQYGTFKTYKLKLISLSRGKEAWKGSVF